MDLLLLSPGAHLCEAWAEAFDGLPQVRIHHGTFQSGLGSYDCLVSPANSFGLMGGGMDRAILDVFGPTLEGRVQDEIWRVYRGQQPVGTCLMVPTRDDRCPWLAHCPTMTVPMDVNGTSNAFAACLAALTTAEAHGVSTLACPGLGTGTGALEPAVAAGQMRYAYDLWRAPRPRVDWPWTAEHLHRSTGLDQRGSTHHNFEAGAHKEVAADADHD